MKLKVIVNGTPYDVDVEVEEERPPTLGGFYLPTTPMPAAVTAPAAPAGAAAGREPANEEKALRAAISGTVTKVNVAPGEQVESGQTLLVLEAMKMETEITAPAAGTIAVVAVEPGEAVTGGQLLVEWE